MNQHDVHFQAQARYFTLGELNSGTKAIWFVLHGYGQLAEYFVHKFDILQDRNIFVIAPEALSRFYLEDVSSRMRSGNNRVGASWMTKENRAMDIANYVTFLNALYQKEVGTSTLPVTLLGFSQGAATVSRWAASGTVNFSRLILWAGVFPPDMDFESGKEIFKNKETALVYGTDDPYINDSRFAEMKLMSDKLGITPSVFTFNGKHDLDNEILRKLT